MRYICCASEAIREGVKLWPKQCFHKFFKDGNAACATGAMIGAVLGRPLTTEEMADPFQFNRVARPITELFKYLNTETNLPCGCTKLVDGPYDKLAGRPVERLNLYNVAVHLNNHHQWTREAIADWLESEEEKLGFVTLVESEEVSVQQ